MSTKTVTAEVVDLPELPAKPKNEFGYLRLPKDLHEMIGAIADIEGCFMHTVVRRAITEYANKQVPEPLPE